MSLSLSLTVMDMTYCSFQGLLGSSSTGLECTLSNVSQDRNHGK